MNTTKSHIVAVLVVVAYLTPAAYGLRCFMCNAFMKSPVAGPCPDNPEYHDMDCMDDSVKYCLKWDGSYVVTNTTSMERRAGQGPYRNCGKDNWIKAFVGSIPTDSGTCKHVEVNNQLIENEEDIEISFSGTFCTCNTETCNGAMQKSAERFVFLGGLLGVFCFVFKM
ncbi:uncharacterized protein LOC129592023 [Paramacrobiotus metropolitanus]|uniref:uncharacterized protein LOC129592023 n=1 Tax=Paramacrobiotus metropolitanus TaxID=2943436 RepID=UPI0024461B76|nr:uncharacterized protein LOC129592023 [Paramacrobiotus metropolitanus]